MIRLLETMYRRTIWFGQQIVRQFGEHGLTDSAASLTYTTLFAVVPLMTVSYTILSVMPDFEGVGTRFQDFLFRNFVPESGAVIQERLADFSNQARNLTVAGLAILVVSAFMLLVSIEKAFNNIWNVTEPRRGLQRFLVYWGVLTCGPPLVVGGILISSYLFSLPLLAQVDTFGARDTLLSYLPILLSSVGFTVLYAAVPNCYVPLRFAFLGGLLTTGTFEAAKLLFAWAVANSDMQLIYGTFAAVPLFLAWLYLVWVLVLSGAIVVRTLSLPRDPLDVSHEPLLVSCVRVLKLLREAHQAGKTVDETEVEAAVLMRFIDRERIFRVLNEMDLIAHADEGGLMLGRDLRGVTLLDLYLRLPADVNAESLARIEDLPQVLAALRRFATSNVEVLAHDLDGLLTEAQS
ncbi:MAG: YihY family inner membrane protein [Gammaproteobacteria bacterium]|nr:YihY family inner membrane protein [Gammaproteobacteria bacterium]